MAVFDVTDFNESIRNETTDVKRTQFKRMKGVN